MPFCSSSQAVLWARQSPRRSWSHHREDAALCGERQLYTLCQPPAALPANKQRLQHITSTIQVSSCQNSILALYIHCSSVALTKIKCSRALLVPLFHPVSHQGLLSPVWAKKKIKNNYVGMSNSSFFKSTLGRLIFIFKLTAQQRLKFESKDWLHHWWLGAAAFI